jgi:polyhydroxybutyrate depolymerase
MISTCLSAVLVCSFMLACNPEKARSRDKPAESGTHELSVAVNGLERTYLVHVPAAYKPQIPLPLVIMFHGGGGTAKAAAWETEWTVKAEKERFLVVFPNALARDPTKASSFAGNPQL